MKCTLVLLLLVVLLSGKLSAQNYYWVGFSDKTNTAFSIEQPADFLSQRAIERRTRQNIPVDSLDLPVPQSYIDSVLSLGAEFVYSSKWLNGITIKTESDTLKNTILSWAFITEVELIKPASTTKSIKNKFDEVEITEEIPIDTSLYGESVYQTGMLNGQFLHQKNYWGQGMQIAILDAGFFNANIYSAFDSLWQNNRILGTRDFVNPSSDFFQTHDHGMSVLSCMGGYMPGKLIGTAPGASYWLLRSEDDETEYKIEEFNWAAAAEFADSVGVDIINSSLGYYEFDDPAVNHTYADMDGKTTHVTRAANIAASRGILVFNSAGNERSNLWQRIIAPSDGDQVIGVGAVGADLSPAYFTSAGPASDGDVKPNVSAMGYQTTLTLSNGSTGKASGTSFSSPVMAGIAACLWQMFPESTAAEMKDVLEKSASQYNSPDSLVGYGIPNMEIAASLLGYSSIEEIERQPNWTVYPNPVENYLVLQNNGNIIDSEVAIELYSPTGCLIQKWIKPGKQKIIIDNMPKGTGIMQGLRI